MNDISVTFKELNEVEEKELVRVVIVSEYKGKWIFCKQKNKDTWELPGGKIEKEETPLAAAKRELYEETGAKKIEIIPICVYIISNPALLCYAKIEKLEKIPNDFEIEEIMLSETLPKNLTYPNTHPKLFNKVIDYIK